LRVAIPLVASLISSRAVVVFGQVSQQGPTQSNSQLPAISDANNPAALDYVVQVPLLHDQPFRQDLGIKGIDFIAHYISETAATTRGTKDTAYAQQIDFGVSLDLGTLHLVPDSIVRFAMSDRAGRSLADTTGSYLAYQEIFGQGQNLRFDEISFEKHIRRNEIAVKVGFYPLGNDFATLPYVCNFTNGALCGHPESLPTNSGWSDGPAGRWGGRVSWKLTDAIALQAGLFDVNPFVTAPDGGFKLDLSGSTGVIAPFEFAYQLGKNPSDYGGTYKIGAYYDSSRAPDLSAIDRFENGRSGLYIESAQQILKWGSERRSGLAVFGVLTLSDRTTATFNRYVESGFACRGPFRRRELDLLSLGWVRTDVNPLFRSRLEASRLPAQNSEQLAEITYTIQAAPSLTLRPGFQYDLHPGAAPSHASTWVLAFQIKLTL
jgi:porin